MKLEKWILAVSLVVSMAACGTKNTESKPGQVAPAAESAQPADGTTIGLNQEVCAEVETALVDTDELTLAGTMPPTKPGETAGDTAARVGKYCRDSTNASPAACIDCVNNALPGDRPNSSIRCTAKWTYCNGIITPH